MVKNFLLKIVNYMIFTCKSPNGESPCIAVLYTQHISQAWWFIIVLSFKSFYLRIHYIIQLKYSKYCNTLYSIYILWYCLYTILWFMIIYIKWCTCTVEYLQFFFIDNNDMKVSVTIIPKYYVIRAFVSYKYLYNYNKIHIRI